MFSTRRSALVAGFALLLGVLVVTLNSGASPAAAANVIDISASGDHTCIVHGGNGVQCFGLNSVGQLGDGTTVANLVPVDVVGLTSGIAAVAVGGAHTCALTTGGSVKCWGWNIPGEVGDGTNIQRTTPVDVVGLSSGVTALATARHTTCAIATGGGVKCWGFNSHGQVGDGTLLSRNTPVDVTGLSSGVAAIGGRRFHMCAVVNTGAVKCWGSNIRGQLGDGTTVNSSVPVDVVGLGTPVASVAASNEATCAVTTAGGLKCWGGNSEGQLGDGQACGTVCTTPIDVPGLTSGVTQVVGGGGHTCALTTSGGVKCWGRNNDGQLGDGTTVDKTTPVDVTGLTSGVAAIAGGRNHTCAATIAGGVLCWGKTYTELPTNVTNLNNKPTPTVTPTATDTPTPTATPEVPSFDKSPELQNLFLTRQGVKIPPANCLTGDDTATIVEQLDRPIPLAPDPKDPTQDQQLGAFEFEVQYDETKVCLKIDAGPAADAMTCIIEDGTSSQLDGVARIGCVTLGKNTFPNTNDPLQRVLATLTVRPQPNEYSIIKPNQDNGNAVQILNTDCKLSDLQGHPVDVASCPDADITIRYLEGDVSPDCSVNALDAAAIAARWGAEKGSLLYAGFMNLEPVIPADNDIDINDLQFVFGRFGSTCGSPHPDQDPVNPKA